MIQVGKWITKHKWLILIVGIFLLVPSVIGMSKTRINYDILSYLPDSLETVKGQDVLVDEFGMGAFSMVIVEDMPKKDVAHLKSQLEKVEHVNSILWYDSFLDLNTPESILPTELEEALFQGNATMMVVLFNNTTSSDDTMDAITQMRKILDKQCFASGMSGVVTDIKNLVQQEMPIYVAIAAILSLVVLWITMDSLITPILFLSSIGIAILYNMGSNIFLGEISYLTQALTAILQLAVSMDYSIFLLESYESNKKRFEGDKERAMSHAIANTFKSVAGSSVTTIAGFLALCFMTFRLGMNIGIVMAKGVVIGVIICVTLLPTLVLIFDNLIEKTTHKPLIPSLNKISAFIVKHYRIAVVVFLVLLLPALYGNNHTGIYYNIAKSLPENLPSALANKELEDKFEMNNVHMVLLKNGLSAKDKKAMAEEIDEIEGVKWVLGMHSVIGSNLPESFISDDYKSMLQSENYELQFICSDYKTATKQVNQQIQQIQDIVKKYSPDSMVIGEAPLTKDLEDVTDVDLKNVNIVSIFAIFVIIMIVFKSISLPILLVLVIEFAIWINMGLPYYMGIELPFVASIVIGTIQLGATVDYAILMSNHYQKARMQGKEKKEAILMAHQGTIKAVLTSGFCFFAATFGVCIYSEIDMISAICTLLARGAIISMLVVITILPAMFMIFDRFICATTWEMKTAVWRKR